MKHSASSMPSGDLHEEDSMMREMARIHGLTDPFLGAYLLKLSRKMRGERPDLAGQAERIEGYTSWLSWELGPELARRLGVPVIGEGGNPIGSLASSTGVRLRRMLGRALRLHGTDVSSGEPESACGLAWRDVRLGNPFAMALDRIAPPGMTTLHADDFIARSVAQARREKGLSGLVWMPAGNPLKAAPAEPRAAPGQTADIIRFLPHERESDDPLCALRIIGMRREDREIPGASLEWSEGGDGLFDLPI